MKKILFLHGFYASGQCVPAVALKEAFEGEANVITPDLPMHPKEAIKSQLINHFSRVTYYRYRRGEYPITPKIEQKITEVCRECGWTAPLTFDTYSDELVW